MACVAAMAHMREDPGEALITENCDFPPKFAQVIVAVGCSIPAKALFRAAIVQYNLQEDHTRVKQCACSVRAPRGCQISSGGLSSQRATFVANGHRLMNVLLCHN